MSRNIRFQDYLLTDPSFKLWVRKSDDKTAICSYSRKKRYVTNGGRITLKQHAGLVPFEGKDKNPKLRTHVACNGSLLAFQKT